MNRLLSVGGGTAAEVAKQGASNVACPSCGASAGEPCRSGTGKVRGPHAPRLDPKQVAKAAARARRAAVESEIAAAQSALGVPPARVTWTTRVCGVCGTGPTDVSGNPLRCRAHCSHRDVATDLFAQPGDVFERLPASGSGEAPAEGDSEADADAGPVWTSEPVDRSGVGAFLHLVRGPNDPAESARGSASERRARWGVAPHATLARSSPESWTGPIVALVTESPEPPTFNAIAVALTGLTADVASDSPLDAALWSLAAAGVLEHTMTVPVRWRVAAGLPGGAAVAVASCQAAAERGEQLAFPLSPARDA